MTVDVERRLSLIEDRLAIGALPARYARAADARDLDTLVCLYVEDVDCGRAGKGREVLRLRLVESLTQFYRSVHFVCGHVIDEIEPTRARGTTYCRAEQEVGDRWVVSSLMYQDAYAKVDGEWYFSSRQPWLWYAADLLERPPEAAFMSWDAIESAEVRLPHDHSTWSEFWSAVPPEAASALTSQPGPEATP